MKSICVYGGSGISGQLSELKRGSEIIVCTPGRMIDVLTTSSGKITNLRRVTYVVIDEADRMFDFGFEPQLAKIFQNIRPDRQTVMFSATFPQNVEQLAKQILKNPIEIVVGERGQTCKNIEQIVEVREETSKFLRLLEILGEWEDRGSILIFVDKKDDADWLFRQLLKHSYNPCILHGGQDPVDRQYTLQDFKKGIRTLMVATSVIARGLDVPSIVLVVNYSCPNHQEDYVHRIGRTGRAGNKGTAITFMTPAEQEMAPEIVRAMKLSGVTPGQDLQLLSKQFRMKVAKGKAKVHQNKNQSGKGYSFKEDEFAQNEKSSFLVKQSHGNDYVISDGGLSDREIIQRSKKMREHDKKSSKRLAFEMIKDPATKQAVMKGAEKAAKDALEAGASQEMIVIAAQNAIKQILQKYKPAHTVAQGIKQAMEVMGNIEEKAIKEGEYMTVFLEINDYPHTARIKVTNQSFLEQVAQLTGCNISIRGAFCERGKKPPLGMRKQFIHIQGETNENVMSAYRELKNQLEEDAEISMMKGQEKAGKFKI